VTEGIAVANAPVSYGAFELTVGIDPNVPDGLRLLDEVSGAGYAGIDLGPVGYLGSGVALMERLRDRGLGLAGAYLEMPFADPAALQQVVPDLDAMLDTFDSVAPHVPGPPPRPTLAVAGSPDRLANPGIGGRDRASGYDDRIWDQFAEGLSLVVARCRERGYEPAFHNETGTNVEAAWEIEQVLGRTDVRLCLDTGHLAIGGGDPVAFLRTWSARIDHLHLKDVRLDRFAEIVAAGEPTTAIWTREVFPRLGDGNVDIDGVLRTAAEVGFSGWLVVEQDIFPADAARFAQAAEDQRANRAFLAARGL
jgi:inosose dehydratase